MNQQEAQRIQVELRERLDLSVTKPVSPKTVAGLDVSYAVDSSRVVAAAVVLELATLDVVDQATAAGTVSFPYVPGLLAFREVPHLLDALGRLKVAPDVLVCDGYGIAHPRRFGLACHIGGLTGLPSFGVAKTPFTTTGHITPSVPESPLPFTDISLADWSFRAGGGYGIAHPDDEGNYSIDFLGRINGRCGSATTAKRCSGVVARAIGMRHTRFR